MIMVIYKPKRLKDVFWYVDDSTGHENNHIQISDQNN